MKNIDEKNLIDFAKKYFKIDKKFNSLKEKYFYLNEERVNFCLTLIKKIFENIEIDEVETIEDLETFHNPRVFVVCYFEYKNKVFRDVFNFDYIDLNNLFECSDSKEAFIDILCSSNYLNNYDINYIEEKVEQCFYNLLSEIKADYEQKELKEIVNQDVDKSLITEKRGRL